MAVTTRLIGLVMLPVTAMCLLTGSVVLSRRSAANQARIVDHGLVGLSQLVSLREALHDQESAEAFNVYFLQVGVTQAAASAFVGFDWSAGVGPARVQADQAVGALGQASPVRASDLRSLYAAIDGGTLSPAAAEQRLAGYIDASGTAVTAGLNRLESDTHQSRLLKALESLRATSGLIDAATPQGIDLGMVWFPVTSDTAQARATVLTRFGAETADYAAALARLQFLDVKTVVAGVTSLAADPQVRAFDEGVTAGLNGQSVVGVGGTVDRPRLTATFGGYVARDRLLGGLVVTATAAVRDQAGLLAASEWRSFLLWALGATLLALASVGIALWLARSISKPLKNLAGYAHAVNEGRLDADAPAGLLRGPAETRLAFAVFADLVSNLQLLDAKANALAHCDFDDPVLAEVLPGRLGRSLDSSVALLSGSIVERDQLQTHLAHEATHDSLTGVANRPAAIAGIQAAMDRGGRRGAATAVLFIDLNEFKAVNDGHGHEIGDDVLRQVAGRMTATVRAGDLVARLGGDEFVVVAEALNGVTEATELARRIIHSLAEPIQVAGVGIAIGAAIGIALTLDGPEEPLRLLARADAAMYRAKRHETSAVEIFDADLQAQMVAREDIDNALTAALADPAGGGLDLVYQPVVDTTSTAMIGVEALIRWQRPHHGLLTPATFIPIAEATNLIIALDCWVLDAATTQLAAWYSVPELAAVSVAVNISARHLLSRLLPAHIGQALTKSGIDAHRLTIEITETVLLGDLIAAAQQLDAVRALGVRVAIDDFGTGYTSLAHLQHLPIDTIKIDQTFTNQLHQPRGRSLVQMITDLGHAIGVNIIAEGVETPQQLDALQAIGADHVQGYYLSRPLSPTTLTKWARQHAHVQGSKGASRP